MAKKKAKKHKKYSHCQFGLSDEELQKMQLTEEDFKRSEEDFKKLFEQSK